ncbi:activator of 2-hydroxyglutaryl-CoA dehydratase [Catalinimonas alkaloidigena]|nr:activator of 2-hydroxyglutaryl-CoA dehydratase [Catalinimonas alkaloidigena]
MRRHQVLIPISREHHELLILAQLLKKNAPPYRGLPETLSGKLAFASEEYNRIIEKHLKRDAFLLFPFLHEFAIFEVTLEELKGINHDLNSALQHTEELTEEEADQLGFMLEKYVRTKERKLFEKMQHHLKESDFALLSKKLY